MGINKQLYEDTIVGLEGEDEPQDEQLSTSPASEPHKPNLLFALPVIGQPRFAKRIEMTKSSGFGVKAIAFERDYHKGRIPDCPITIVRRIDHGRYVARIWKMLRSIPVYRRAIKDSDIVYAFGPDMALLCLVSGLGLAKPVTMEIGDIRKVQTSNGIKGRMVRFVDKWLTNSCSLLVATAPGFIDGYYRQWLKVKTPALIVENKLGAQIDQGGESQPEIETMAGTPLVDRPLRIGYFGLLRCDRSWQALEYLASLRPEDIEITVAGIPALPKDLAERAKKHTNIKFKGQYRSPQDLPSLYNNVDIVWACYPFPKSDEQNWKWARTNRFYESCSFKKPMIVLEGSGDAHEVKHHGLGILVQNAEDKKVTRIINNITPKDLKTWQTNMASLPQNVYTYTTETEELKQAIINIVADHRWGNA